MKASVALIAAGLALLASGCRGDDDELPPEVRPTPKLVETTAVGGASRPERAVLRRVVGGMGGTTLERITIAVPERRRRGKAVALTFAAVPGATARQQWDEWIIAGALSRRLLADGLPAEVDATGSYGAFTARPKVRGQPDPRPLAAGREAAIVKGIRDAAKGSGAEVVRLEVHRPFGVAVVLSLAPDNAATFLKTRLRPLLRKLDTYRRQLEGIYLSVLGADRRLALEWGSWTRNPAGTYWVRHDLANCSPIRQSEPPGTGAPPPCPV